MTLEQRYPKLFANIEDKDIELRHLINIDENYEDFDSEEYEFDFEDFNYVVYISEIVQNALGDERLVTLISKLESREEFENFLASEEDLYALKSNLEMKQIEDMILSIIEEIA
jgi:hypothetical protein